MTESMSCRWRLDDPDDGDSSPFVTSCNNYFQFNDGGPIDNGFKFCPYCGAELEGQDETHR